MKLLDWFKKLGIERLNISTPFLQMELNFNDVDRQAGWELYVEMMTRISTQDLDENSGDEESALNSMYALFTLTREIVKKHGPECLEFTKLAIIMMNQIMRPFTSKWHKIKLQDGFSDPSNCQVFRKELSVLQQDLRRCNGLLAEMIGIEDITELETI